MVPRVPGPPDPRGPRLRELGLRIGALEAGPADAITDVPGVRVGHVTVWRDAPGQAARDGRDGDRPRDPGCSARRCPPAPPCSTARAS